MTAVVVVPSTVPGQRLLATVGIEQANSLEQQNAVGTQAARVKTWSGIDRWSQEDPVRRWFGTGFGNDFLAQAGVIANLEGTTYDNVRSPHNWFVANLARLGIMGVLLSVGVIGHALLLAWRRRKLLGEDPFALTASLIVIAVIPVATLGVVLEAPFGAVPFWWSLGILYAIAKQPAQRQSPRLRKKAAAAKA